jgi:hypothetical protein
MTFLVAVASLAACAPSGHPDVATRPAAPASSAQAAPASAAESVAVPVAAETGRESAPRVRVYLDPVTGEAREPTRAEAAAAAAAAAGGRVQREAAGGQAVSEGAQRERVVLPDGTEGVKLAPRDRHSVVVCRQADGSFGEKCPAAPAGSMP